MEKRIKTVFVGVSGGVDSSVSAALLKEQGYNVVGVFIRTWTPDFIECTWRTERRDAMRVCAHLEIPFLECDAEEEYKKNVADYMVREYEKGNTPNPDVMCNREVKFGTFWKFAKAHGADFIATGHYAKILCSKGSSQSSLSLSASRDYTRGYGAPTPVAFQGPFELHKGIDDSKDQSYFLWTLNQEDLGHILFPIGHLKKTKVRKIALKYNLPTATKKDSQGVCFLGPLDMKDFLKHYIKSEKGNVLNEKGEIVGSHGGAIFFTLGERHGFTLFKHSENDKPFYIVSKDIKNNTVTVSPRSDLGEVSARQDLAETSSERKIQQSRIVISYTNWILEIPKINQIYNAQIRYHGELLKCSVDMINQIEAKIIFEKEILVDKGQSIVVYNKDVCLGGGIVK